MQTKKVPMRKCTGYEEQKPKRESIRAAHNKEGETTQDDDRKQQRRGAYLCPNPECLKKAKKNRGLERGLSTRIDPEIYEKLEQEIGGYESKVD